MSFTKSNIALNIAKKTSISKKKSNQLLDKFLQVVVHGCSKDKVKISKFGTFEFKVTPERIGRNPKNGLLFPISKRAKLNLVVSNKVKKLLNWYL